MAGVAVERIDVNQLKTKRPAHSNVPRFALLTEPALSSAVDTVNSCDLSKEL